MKRLALVAWMLVAWLPGWGQSFETTPAWIEPEVFYGEFGRRVALLDADGDGISDVAVSGPFYTDQSPSVFQFGAVLFYPGASAGLPEAHTWSEIGAEQGTTLGWHLTAGDVNADGRDDLVFSSGSGFGNGTQRVHVRFGSVVGPRDGWDYDSGELFGALGPTLAVGDVNHDGFDDVVAGLASMDAGNGRLIAFHGSATGLPAFPDWEKNGDAGQQLGLELAAVGDVDADGFDDVLVCDGFESLFLFRGSASGLEVSASWSDTQSGPICFETGLGAAGDVNGDGYADFAVRVGGLGANGEESGVRLFLGSASGPQGLPPLSSGLAGFGHDIAAAGDVNGDGFDDLLVGSPQEGDTGRVDLFAGSPVGLQPVPVWSATPPPGSSALGLSVASGGDVNDDGLTDVVVGDPAAPIFPYGRALLFYGVQPLGGGPAGSFEDMSTALVLDRDPTRQVRLAWAGPCATADVDYSVYRGDLGSFDGHVPVTCSTGMGTSWVVTAGGGDRFYLVVPRSLDAEGSYGLDHAGRERAPSLESCEPQAIRDCP